ncbi:hypothetical protein GD416_20035 [Burkholderia sp. BE24]|nr:hypothetical protein [Burkholderia sp. BE24]
MTEDDHRALRTLGSAHTIRAAFFGSALHPDTLACERRRGASWMGWKPCAASCSILYALVLIVVRRGGVLLARVLRDNRAACRRPARVSHNDRADRHGRSGR